MSKKKKGKQFAMYNKYGEHSHGVICAGCCNCVRVGINDFGRAVCKCIAYGDDGTPATNWNPRFTACGYINMPFDETEQLPVMGSAGINPTHIDDIINTLVYKGNKAYEKGDIYILNKCENMLKAINDYIEQNKQNEVE